MKLAKSAVLSLLLTLTPIMAYAQASCYPRAEAEKSFNEGAGETPQVMGLVTSGDAIMEIWANTTTGTWTATLTNPEGITCGVASGMGYAALNNPPAPKGDDM